MATFTALNIEPDDHSDDEVDNTKEIQIEDALKLYQTALKFHSQGTSHYGEAAEAYMKLFNSEIFLYPESQTLFDRIYNHPDLELDASFAIDLDLAANGAQVIPSTLPQILYLSYKNHGQFILDCVKGRLKYEPLEKTNLDYQAKAAMNFFARALWSDESDTELWRKAARVGAMLGSRRIARFCLEAAVEVDDDPTVAEIEPYSLEEGFAGRQLMHHLEILDDYTALAHPIMGPYVNKNMPAFLTNHMDPYPFLPNPIKLLGGSKSDVVPKVSHDIVVSVEYRSWALVGEVLWNHFFQTQGMSRSRVTLVLPPLDGVVLAAAILDGSLETTDQVMSDAPVIESPAAETGEQATPSPVPFNAENQPGNIEGTTTVPTPSGSQEAPVSLPNRKRSQSTAGIRETAEDGSGTQKRSKRLQDRDVPLEIQTRAAQLEEQLAVFTKADTDVFDFVDELLHRIDVYDLGAAADVQVVLNNDSSAYKAHEHAINMSENTAVRDLRQILSTWNEPMASTFISCNPAEVVGSKSGNETAGLAAFLEHSKTGPLKLSRLPIFEDAEGLDVLAAKMNDSWLPLQDAIWKWLQTILFTYTTQMWPAPLKTATIRLISLIHVELYQRLKFEMEGSHSSDRLIELQTMVQTIFELNIDLYTQICLPDSVVGFEVRLRTRDQLDRWKDFAAEIIGMRARDLKDPLQVRYIWASVFYATMSDEIRREHKVDCWSDLKSILQSAECGTIELQNNAIIPQISIDAADREVSRLSSMDFFYNLFQTDQSDPIAIIETLEPVLDPSSSQSKDVSEAASPESTNSTSSALKDMWKFLETGSISLRLYLWQRLREAYVSIGYNTKVFSCHLKCIEIIMENIRSTDFVDSAEMPRQHELLRWLKALDDQLVKALSIALNDAATCFEIIDGRHIKSTCSALAQLSRMLQVAAMYDDEVRVGKISLPQTSAFALPNGSFHIFFNKLREMQVRTWALQYTMIKEAMSQNREQFPTPDNDLADYLALVHYALGMRRSCRTSNKIFLKMMKVEMIRLKHIERWEDYLGQVLFDLYGISLGVGTYMLEDHGCPVEQLDRRTVMNIAEKVIALANTMPMKDLLKHELRVTIEKMQTAVGHSKPSPQMIHNLRNYTEYLKTSIRPLDMYKAWQGQVQVDSLPVNTPESPLADEKWYFLLGMIALTKFRSQKRLSPGAQQDDLRVSASFFRLQLQFDAEHWETWFRMAQCFDYELEDEVMFTSDKINNHRADLVRLQRSSIHCYVMALSCAMRSADSLQGTAEKLSEMYYEFGMRIYSSSREPFGMEAFWVDDFEKHMSGSTGMYKKHLHDEMTRYRAWKFAARLFRESVRDRPENWMAHFMLGKCLWKMFCKSEDEYDPQVKANKPTIQDVTRPFIRAIKTVPKLDRNSRAEPVLEPHYKLVSIIHKAVRFQAMELQDGADILQKQPYAIKKGEVVKIDNEEQWEPYMIETLRHLRSFDKQHWHHRMVARVANIMFEDTSPDYIQAEGAIHVFRESIFTKTMHIQVWKPDAERPGRHCVYMERYVRLMTKLFFTVNDKTNLEALVRRVRKRAVDFHRFSTVWTDCCTTYLRLIRRTASISPSTDEIFKGESHEEFEVLSDRLTAWISESTNQHPVLEALREASELKKINAGFMKPAPIDDLINDAWGVLYLQIAKALPGPHPHEMHGHISQMDGGGEVVPPPPPRVVGPMNLANLVMDMGDTQIPVPVTFAGSDASRPRKVGISRREIGRRAELAVNRVAEVPRVIASANSRPRLSELPPSMILGSNDGSTGAKQSGVSTPRPAAEGEGAREEERGEEESERGSVHDSADDESDLSDLPSMDGLDDHVTIFPNLMRNPPAATAVGDGAESATPRE